MGKMSLILHTHSGKEISKLVHCFNTFENETINQESYENRAFTISNAETEILIEAKLG